jgi:hypothetical protein
MFIQIPQVVDDGGTIAVYQLFASKRLAVLPTPRLQVIFQTCDVVKQQGHSIRCCRSVRSHREINRSLALISNMLGRGLYRGQLLRDLHFCKCCV